MIVHDIVLITLLRSLQLRSSTIRMCDDVSGPAIINRQLGLSHSYVCRYFLCENYLFELTNISFIRYNADAVRRELANWNNK